MCLELLSKKLVAKEDITCYKVVTKRKNKLYTLYQDYEIQPGILKASGTVSEDWEDWEDERRSIREGVIHTFAKYDQALDEKTGKKNVVIYKCIIPKGTSYYIGLFRAYLSYGSELINILEECNEDTDKPQPIDQKYYLFWRYSILRRCFKISKKKSNSRNWRSLSRCFY